MKEYWREVRSLLDLLGYLVKTRDPNGVDLYFTCPGRKYLKIKTTTELLEAFDRNQPNGSSNMSATLSSIVRDYQIELAKSHTSKSMLAKLKPKAVRPLSLYVFTDAIWQPVCEVEPVVISLVNAIKKKNGLKTEAGIQFIRFGDDPRCQSRLVQLDRMKVNGKIDM